MRIWQKIYFVTLLLFLVMLNVGLFFAAKSLFSYNLAQEQKKAETDCFFICQNLEHDFSILERNGRYRENVVALLFGSYQAYYKKQDIILSLEKTDKAEASVLRSEVIKGGKQAEIFAERNLGDPYQLYRVSYHKRLVDFEAVWDALKRTFVTVSLVTSILLCLILYVLMRRMLKPLGRLNEMSRTIQRQIADLEKESEKKQQLMDNMAHELKTPLTSIYGYAEYVKYAKASEEEKLEGLTYIMEESRRLAKMSEIMLSMRLYEKESPAPEKVSLNAVATHLEKTLAGKLREKSLAIRREFETETAFAEETLLINLFRNLLENAIRASRAGDDIVFRTFRREETQIFEIIDFGIGMEETELERITEAFYRVDKARSRKDGGVGLGLSIANLIVKKLGGTMAFASSPGKGTKATVILQHPNNNVKSL